jgi:hypothetical protein
MWEGWGGITLVRCLSWDGVVRVAVSGCPENGGVRKIGGDLCVIGVLVE